jgi:hypothetical protein
MKSAHERPSVWYVIVPLAAMFYLWDFNPWQVLVNSAARLFFGSLLVCIWLFLIYDLLRQISRFFRKSAQ